MTLWYSMYGSGIGTLSIIGNNAVTWSKTGGFSPVCATYVRYYACSMRDLCNACVLTSHTTGDQGHGWSKAYVFIGAHTSYTIDVKATIGKSPEARIAFDDFGFLHCHDSGTSFI